MNKSSSIAAAFSAGKLPSQQQWSTAIDAYLDTPLLTNVRTERVGELSEQGKQLQEGVRGLLLAYQKLGDDKDGESPHSFYSPLRLKGHAMWE